MTDSILQLMCYHSLTSAILTNTEVSFRNEDCTIIKIDMYRTGSEKNEAGGDREENACYVAVKHLVKLLHVTT